MGWNCKHFDALRTLFYYQPAASDICQTFSMHAYHFSQGNVILLYYIYFFVQNFSRALKYLHIFAKEALSHPNDESGSPAEDNDDITRNHSVKERKSLKGRKGTVEILQELHFTGMVSYRMSCD